jgi:hypothetical protein
MLIRQKSNLIRVHPQPPPPPPGRKPCSALRNLGRYRGGWVCAAWVQGMHAGWGGAGAGLGHRNLVL